MTNQTHDHARLSAITRLKDAINHLTEALHVLETAPALAPDPRVGGRPWWRDVVDSVWAESTRAAQIIQQARRHP